MKYGVQLYSLRKMIESNGLEEAIKTVAFAGYQGVEFAGFYGYSPNEIKSLLEKYELIAISAHIQAEAVEDYIEYIDVLNIKRVYTAGISDEFWLDENYPETICQHKKALDFLNKRGISFGYHNHAHEYKDGKDLVAKITDDVLGMKIELDIGWLTDAGRDVVETMKPYENKLEIIHIKELRKGAPNNPAPLVGKGSVDMLGTLKEAKRQRLEWGIVEVEYFDMPEKEYLSKSLKNIKEIEKIV